MGALAEGGARSAELEGLVQRALETLTAHEVARAALESAADVRQSIGRVFAASDFVAQSWARDPALFAALICGADLRRRLAAHEFTGRAPPLTGATSETQAQSALRRWRRAEFTRIAWRDLAGWAGLDETLADLSAFADAAIGTA
ncbi:MAG: hypothetical protein ACRETP_13135, partial [Steroidobacteraceae bacterium]